MAGKIIVLHILRFRFLEKKNEGKRFWTKRQLALPDFNLVPICS
jgi:hypothetical protein